MKKSITIVTITICIIFIADETKGQTVNAVKTPVPVTHPAIKDTARAVTKPGIKTTMPDPIAAVTNQGTEVIKPIVTTIVKLPAVSDQNGKAKQE